MTTRANIEQKLARILFVAHTAGIGGPTNSLLMLLRYLRDRYWVAVLLPEEGALTERLAGEDVPYFVVPGLTAGTIMTIFQLLRRERVDLVYGNNPSNCSRNAMLAARLARRPFVWHFRGMKWHWSWRKGFFVRWADAVVAVSEACAASIERFYRHRPIQVIYNGVEVASYSEDRPAARVYVAEQLGLPPQVPYVVNTSHLMARKGHEEAVAIMARLVEQVPDAHLLIAGSLDRDPAYVDSVRTLIRQRGLEGHVHLLGLRNDVPKLLGAADVFLHTADRDPHPRSVIEAMAAGVPVVAFAVDGVAETVVEGETGCLVEPGQVRAMTIALQQLLEQRDQRVRMGANGQQRIGRFFTAQRTADQVAAVIEALLGTGNES